MPFRNVLTICLSAVVCLFCYMQARRIRPVEPVLDAFQHVTTRYVDEVDSRELMESTMNGLIGTLDPYSVYISPRDYEAFQSMIVQRFAGIGILIEMDEAEEHVRVLTPLVGTPALESGIMPGDLILEVDGENAVGLNLEEISTKLRGPVGTTVDLVVGRGEDEEVEIQVRRADIPLESVIGDHRIEGDQWAYHLAEYPEIGYIRVTNFGEQTAEELRAALAKIPDDAKGLVIDLRNNQGGLLDAAVQMCDMFLDSGAIVSTNGRASPEQTIEATPGTIVPAELPLALLINENSASASEVMAGCLQDHGRAIVGGTRSYGKGSVQHVLPLEEGRSALKLTTAYFYRPSGRNIHRTEALTEDDLWGVEPREDLTVSLSDDQRIRLAQRWQRAAMPFALRQQLEAEEAVASAADDRDAVEGGAAPSADDGGAVEPTAEERVEERVEKSGESDASEATSGESRERAGPLSDDPQLRRLVERLWQSDTAPLAVEAKDAPAA